MMFLIPQYFCFEITTPTSLMFQHLPDVFTGMKFHLPQSLPDHTELKRYIVAFDGDVTPDFDQSSATHVVMGGADSASGESEASVPVVTSDWLWRCIQEQTIVPCGE